MSDSDRGRRLKQSAGSFFSGLFNLVLTLAILMFALATCTGRVKSTLGCLGLSREDRGPQLKVREPDPGQPKDARLVASLEKMTSAAAIPRSTLRIAVIDSQELNAASLDGRSFLLFGGLTEAPDLVLDSIMAHETAHAIGQHAEDIGRFARIVGGVTEFVGALLGADRTGREEAAQWTVGIAVPSRSKEAEFAADEAALGVLAKAGYGEDAAAVMQTALEYLAAKAGPSGGGLLDTHPALDERIGRIRSKRPTQLAWERLEAGMKEVFAEARVKAFLAQNHLSVGQVSTGTMRYLSDEEMLDLMALRLRIVTAASEPVCAAFFSKESTALPAAVAHLDEDAVGVWLSIIRAGMEAQVRGEKPRELSKPLVKAAYASILAGLPAEEATRYRELSKKEAPSQTELCWGAKRLYGGIVALPDRAAAAQLSFAVAGYLE